MVIATGAHIGPDNMCDTASRWEVPPVATGENVTWTWRNKTGGDTLWASSVTEAAVYVGGHQRWLNNPWPTNNGDRDGPGAVSRPGIAALDPLTGVPLSWNPGRDRGRGAEAIHPTSTHLFVGSDTDYFGGAIRQRLAALPVAGGTPNPQPVDVQLPVDLYVTSGDRLLRTSFDGATLGTPSTVSSPSTDGNDWSSVRDGFVQHGRLHYFGGASSFYARPFSSAGIGQPVNLSATVGYVHTAADTTAYDQPLGVGETTVATYHQGRIYYVKSGDPKLYQRGYSLESGIIESAEQVASARSFAGATALDFIGSWLYAAWDDGRLYRFHAPRGRVDVSTRTLVDNGARIDWRNVGGMWSTPRAGTAVEPATPAPITCDGSTPWKAEYWANTTYTGAPSTTRCETAVNYDYGTGAPAGAEVPADGFAVAWTRTVTTTDVRSLRVTATADDGVRAYVDGRRIIDDWIDTAVKTRTGTSKALPAGAHTVRVEYYERTAGASARVQVDAVAPVAPDPEPDNLPGETSVTAPAQGASLGVGTVSLAGQATDDRAVGKVHVAVYNRNDTTNRWLQADGTWGPAYAFRTATLAAPGTSSTGWSLDVPLPVGDYAVDARSFDSTGNEDKSPAWRTFSVRGSDTAPPTVAVGSPTAQETVRTRTVNTSGTATDDTGVDQVRVAVYNRNGDTGTRWLQADGTWGSTFVQRTATLVAPGATSTGWRLALDLPDGAYALDVRAYDRARNESQRAWVPFTTSTVQADTVAPSATVTRPARNTAVAAGRVDAEGSSTDDRAVGSVRVGVYNRALPETPWLQADGTWGATYAARTATLSGAGSASTGWSLGVDLREGSYALDVRAVDSSGNASPTVWWPFTVTAP